CPNWESRYALPALVYDPNFLDNVPPAADLGQRAHLLSNIETHTPEIDDVAAHSQLGRFFNDRRLQAVMRQPIRKRRSCNSRSAYQDLHNGRTSIRDMSRTNSTRVEK